MNECQLQAFPVDADLGPPSRDEPWGWYLRRRARNLFRKLAAWLRRGRPAAGRTPAPPIASAAELAAGDLVRVRSAVEIAKTLDATGTCRGCPFSPAMYGYCGRELRVARVVHRFFDEARWRMLRARNIVLLEGAHCDGSGLPDTAGCDRMCFFFWRTEWLEKVR